MRTLNVRLAAILLAVVVVFGGGVFGVHAYMISKNRTIFADEARKAEEDMAAAKKAKDFTGAGKDFQEAMKYWTWYLRLAPDDNKAPATTACCWPEKRSSRARRAGGC